MKFIKLIIFITAQLFVFNLLASEPVEPATPNMPPGQIEEDLKQYSDNKSKLFELEQKSDDGIVIDDKLRSDLEIKVLEIEARLGKDYITYRQDQISAADNTETYGDHQTARLNDSTASEVAEIIDNNNMSIKGQAQYHKNLKYVGSAALGILGTTMMAYSCIPVWMSPGCIAGGTAILTGITLGIEAYNSDGYETFEGIYSYKRGQYICDPDLYDCTECLKNQTCKLPPSKCDPKTDPKQCKDATTITGPPGNTTRPPFDPNNPDLNIPDPDLTFDCLYNENCDGIDFTKTKIPITNPDGTTTFSTSANSLPSGLKKTYDMIQGLKKSGFGLSGDQLVLPNGKKASLSNLNSQAGLASLGIKDPAGFQSKMQSAIDAGKKKVGFDELVNGYGSKTGEGLYGDGGGAGGSRFGGNSGSGSNKYGAGGRTPTSTANAKSIGKADVSGLSKSYGDDKIGLSSDSIFGMVNRSYQEQRKRKDVIE